MKKIRKAAIFLQPVPGNALQYSESIQYVMMLINIEMLWIVMKKQIFKTC